MLETGLSSFVIPQLRTSCLRQWLSYHEEQCPRKGHEEECGSDNTRGKQKDRRRRILQAMGMPFESE